MNQVCDAVDVPVCGIGGINAANLSQVVSANVAMAALISYVWRTDNPLREIVAMHTALIREKPRHDTTQYIGRMLDSKLV